MKYLVSWVGVAVWMARDGYDQVMSEMRSEQREESDMGAAGQNASQEKSAATRKGMMWAQVWCKVRGGMSQRAKE